MQERPPFSDMPLAAVKEPLPDGASCVAVSDSVAGWEEPDCLLCGGKRRQVVVHARHDSVPGDQRRCSVVRCLDCGLNFTSPRPTPDSISGFYPEGYGPKTDHKLHLVAILFTGTAIGILVLMAFIIIFLCRFKKEASHIIYMQSVERAGVISALITAFKEE